MSCEDSCLVDVEEFDRGTAEIAGIEDLDMFEGWDGWVREVEAGKQRRSRGFGAALAAEKEGARVTLPPHSGNWFASSPPCFSRIPAVGCHRRLRNSLYISIMLSTL